MAQVDLNGTSTPRAPFIDASSAYNSVHVPAGLNRTSPADNPSIGDNIAPTNVKVTVAGVRFANPA